MSKILRIDIDSTLVDYENRLPASAVEVLLEHLGAAAVRRSRRRQTM